MTSEFPTVLSKYIQKPGLKGGIWGNLDNPFLSAFPPQCLGTSPSHDQAQIIQTIQITQDTHRSYNEHSHIDLHTNRTHAARHAARQTDALIFLWVSNMKKSHGKSFYGIAVLSCVFPLECAKISIIFYFLVRVSPKGLDDPDHTPQYRAGGGELKFQFLSQ